MKTYGYTSAELKLFRRLNTPQKIQDYLNLLAFNHEDMDDKCMSPRKVIETQKADCVEGAVFASAILQFHGAKPWILDLRSTIKPYDYDHVVAIFKKDGHFGAISKTTHAVLRYREPIYKTLRELVLSYFHEYFLDSGQKTLREYSDILDMSIFNKQKWQISEESIDFIPKFLDTIKHHKILSPKQIKNLRRADRIEIQAGKLKEGNSIKKERRG